jgi:hypothetical protein
MKKFLITINAYDHYAKFEVSSEDNPVALEQAIVDKLGVNDINWEYLGGNTFDSKVNRITYEEVINDAKPSYSGLIQTEEVSGIKMGAGAS